MKPRRMRNYVRPERRKAHIVRSSTPLTVEQVRQIEANWERHGGGRVRVQVLPPDEPVFVNRLPWWRRWLP